MESGTVRDRHFLLYLGVYVLLGMLIVARTPFGGFPDEISHFAFIKYLRSHHALPKLSADVPGISVAFHPPLYYFCASNLIDPSGTDAANIRSCRVFSLLLGALALFLLWKSASLVFPNSSFAVHLSVAFAAWNPQFIFIHSGISNIAMTSVTCSLMIFLMLRVCVTRTRHALQGWILGVSFGLALMSRSVAIYLFPAAVLVLYLAAVRESGRPGLWFWKSVFALCVSAFVISGWWFLRNWLEFGDPFQFRIGRLTAGPGFTPENSLSPLYLAQTAGFLHASYWAYFGRMEFHAGVAEYAFYLVLEALAFAGALQIVLQRGLDEDFRKPAFERGAFLLLLLLLLLAVAEIFLFNLKISSPQGRYLFMAVVPISVTLAGGIAKVIERGRRRAICGLLNFSLFLMCCWLLYSQWFRKY